MSKIYMNPIRPTWKTELFPVLALIAAFIAGIVVVLHLPPVVPIHWNTAGVADGWGSRYTAAFFMPVIVLAVYLLLLALPYLDPRDVRHIEFRNPYHALKAAIVAALLVAYAGLIAQDLGKAVPINSVFILLGVLFVVVGATLPRLGRNWMMGIRNPWTLTNETVWHRTHRFGGKVFIIAGILSILTAFLPGSSAVIMFIIIILAAVILVNAYSWRIYEHLEDHLHHPRQ